MASLYDFFQNFRLHNVEYKTDTTASTAVDNQAHLKQLQDKVDYLSIVSLAMLECLQDMGYSEKMILEKIQRIDLKDGKADGKLSSSNCPSCNKVVSPRHYSCIYCGESLRSSNIL